MWVTGARGCAVRVSACLSVCPCCVSRGPTGVPGPHKHPHTGSSLPGSPSASDPLGASAAISATPVPDPRSPANPLPQAAPRPDRHRQCRRHSPRQGRARGSPSSLPVPPSCSPVLAPALFPVLTVSLVTPCTVPLLPVPRCLPPLSGATSSAHPPLRYRFFPAAAGPSRRGLCGSPPAADTPGPSASPTPVQHPLPVPVSPGAGKSHVPALCAGKSRCPGFRCREVPVPVSTVGCSRCQQAPARVNPSASLLAPTNPVPVNPDIPDSGAS